MEQTDFLHFDADSQKLKADQKFFGLASSRMGFCQPGHVTLELTLS